MGEASVAAPVADSSGQPVGAIGVGLVERALAGPARLEVAVALRVTDGSLSRVFGALRGTAGRT